MPALIADPDYKEANFMLRTRFGVKFWMVSSLNVPPLAAKLLVLHYNPVSCHLQTHMLTKLITHLLA